MQSNYNVSDSKALKTVLDDFSSNSIFSEDDIDRYILAFSFYLSAGDDAYRYHTDFLAQKHSSFRDFLRKAEEKQERLLDFIKRLNGCREIVQWRMANPAQAGEICISIDDFCQGNLAGDISLCEEVSIKGAQWGKNIITVHFRKQTASFFCPRPDKDVERAARIFLSLVTDSSEGGEAK